MNDENAEKIFGIVFYAVLILIASFLIWLVMGMSKDFIERFECKNEIYLLPIEKIYMHPYGTIEDPYREDLHGEIRCSCVRAVRSWGVELAYDLEPKDLDPNIEIEIGAVALFKGENHVGLVTGIGENVFRIKEANYLDCEITEREINFDDVRLTGFYK